jgi:hypothetical protein
MFRQHLENGEYMIPSRHQLNLKARLVLPKGGLGYSDLDLYPRAIVSKVPIQRWRRSPLPISKRRIYILRKVYDE